MLTFNHGQAGPTFETISYPRTLVWPKPLSGRNSRYSHGRLRDLNLTARYGMHVLAIHRHNRETFRDNLGRLFSLTVG